MIPTEGRWSRQPRKNREDRKMRRETELGLRENPKKDLRKKTLPLHPLIPAVLTRVRTKEKRERRRREMVAQSLGLQREGEEAGRRTEAGRGPARIGRDPTVRWTPAERDGGRMLKSKKRGKTPELTVEFTGRPTENITGKHLLK